MKAPRLRRRIRGHLHRGEKDWIAFRLGRQELNYGSCRLVSVREGPNVRQSFDGFKIMSKEGSWYTMGLPCVQISITLGTSTIIPITRRAFGGYIARALSAAEFRWISTTSVLIPTRLPTSGARLTSCGTPRCAAVAPHRTDGSRLGF
jgi:hypothetical protein